MQAVARIFTPRDQSIALENTRGNAGVIPEDLDLAIARIGLRTVFLVIGHGPLPAGANTRKGSPGMVYRWRSNGPLGREEAAIGSAISPRCAVGGHVTIGHSGITTHGFRSSFSD